MSGRYPLSAQMAAFVAASQAFAAAAQRAAYRALCAASSPPRPPGLAVVDLPLAGVPARRYLPARTAFVAVAEFDPLRDDGARYAERLAADGVPVCFEPGLGLVHGCLRGLGRVAEVDRLYARLSDWLAAALGS